jgi:Skp family chaperone for outer membrane proteins
MNKSLILVLLFASSLLCKNQLTTIGFVNLEKLSASIKMDDKLKEQNDKLLISTGYYQKKIDSLNAILDSLHKIGSQDTVKVKKEFDIIWAQYSNYTDANFSKDAIMSSFKSSYKTEIDLLNRIYKEIAKEYKLIAILHTFSNEIIYPQNKVDVELIQKAKNKIDVTDAVIKKWNKYKSK